MDAMLWMLNIAWKVALLIIGWKTLKYITRNCGDTFQEVLNTIGLCFRAGCKILREKAIKKLSTARKTEEPETKDEEVKVEATVI